MSKNTPTNKALYNRVKAEAKKKFDTWPSAYASAWLVKTYKKRGGGYRKAEMGMEVDEYGQGGMLYGDQAYMYGGEDTDMEEYAKGGGIPQRYKNKGFTKVGAKKKSTRPGKKWMVLAKKGDKYKIVHGGDSNMKDFKQHGSAKRKERFWDRMGGRNGPKAKDPFSPLYWHKRFGTWAEGGEFEPHMMYNPETGEGYMANSMDDHLEMKDMGYLHEDEMQEGGESSPETFIKEFNSKMDSIWQAGEDAKNAYPERMQAGEYYDTLNVKPRYTNRPDDYYKKNYDYYVNDPYRIERNDDAIKFQNDSFKEDGYTTDDRFYPLSEFTDDTKNAQLEMVSRSLGMLLKNDPVPGASYDFVGTAVEGFDQVATVSEDGRYATFIVNPNLKQEFKGGHAYPSARVVVPLGVKEDKIKLPYKGLSLNKSQGVTPEMMVNPFPKIYSRKLNQQTGEYIYDTSQGTIRNKIGSEDSKFVNMYRNQIDNLRSNRKVSTPVPQREKGDQRYAEGGPINKGFQSLPEEVQKQIIANMEAGGQMYGSVDPFSYGGEGKLKTYQFAGQPQPEDLFTQEEQEAMMAGLSPIMLDEATVSATRMNPLQPKPIPNLTPASPTMNLAPVFKPEETEAMGDSEESGMSKMDWAMTRIAGASMVNDVFDNLAARKRQAQQRQNLLSDNFIPMDTGNDRGDFDINTGIFRPDSYVPTQYKAQFEQGGQIGMVDEETLKALIAAGADIELLD